MLDRLTKTLDLLASAGQVVLIAILIRAALMALDVFAWTGSAK